MSIFVCQGKLSSNDWKALRMPPNGITKKGQEVAARMEARILSYYITFGALDYIMIVDAPDAMTASVLASAVAGAGDLTAVPAMLPEDAIKTYAKADTVVAALLPGIGPELIPA